jgi:hypothetical protein
MSGRSIPSSRVRVDMRGEEHAHVRGAAAAARAGGVAPRTGLDPATRRPGGCGRSRCSSSLAEAELPAPADLAGPCSARRALLSVCGSSSAALRLLVGGSSRRCICPCFLVETRGKEHLPQRSRLALSWPGPCLRCLGWTRRRRRRRRRQRRRCQLVWAESALSTSQPRSSSGLEPTPPAPSPPRSAHVAARLGPSDGSRANLKRLGGSATS